MPETLETLLAYYCAPAFAGIKPSNIATIQKSQIPNLHGEIDRLNKELNSRDIYCFINHRNRDCLMVGEWRVYHNSEEAAKMFSRFKLCRAALVRMVTQRGKTLAQIFCAA